jgi:hypothetical protein
MRLFGLIPLAFVAGADGFALFAPYMSVVLLAAHFLRRPGSRPAAIAAA